MGPSVAGKEPTAGENLVDFTVIAPSGLHPTEAEGQGMLDEDVAPVSDGEAEIEVAAVHLDLGQSQQGKPAKG